MDVYLFDLEHLAPIPRGLDSDSRSPGAGVGDGYDLAELNRLVWLDERRFSDLS